MKNVKLTWQRNDTEFGYKTFDRTHLIDYPNGVRVLACASADYYGDDRMVNPEQTLIGALSSCFMLTFLALASLKGFKVDSYEDNAEGELDKNEAGRLWVARITLRPEVVFTAGDEPDQEAFAELFERAHQGCFIANSIKSDVTVSPRM
ncbi:MAG: OsmC family protein [Gammaproteobacteria bacterium]|nr:OsmC family protein [Gammaproteobacteria bacterium]